MLVCFPLHGIAGLSIWDIDIPGLGLHYSVTQGARS